eukprot:4358183-Amphidinium_carterae.1
MGWAAENVGARGSYDSVRAGRDSSALHAGMACDKEVDVEMCKERERERASTRCLKLQQHRACTRELDRNVGQNGRFSSKALQGRTLSQNVVRLPSSSNSAPSPGLLIGQYCRCIITAAAHHHGIKPDGIMAHSLDTTLHHQPNMACNRNRSRHTIGSAMLTRLATSRCGKDLIPKVRKQRNK